jgi:folate/biopterin transporter
MKIIYIIKCLLLTSSASSAFIIQTPLHSIIRYKRPTISKINTYKMTDENKSKNFFPISWSECNHEYDVRGNSKKQLMLFDIPATPEIWAISLVYFAQGLLGISRLALSFYYKDTLHLTPVDLTMIGSISVIPWVIKPLYGFISDTFPLFGYKRKSYLVISGFIGAMSWKILSIFDNMLMSNDIHTDFNSIAFSVLLVSLSSLGLAFSDVLVDAIVVGKSRDQNKSGSLQSICWASSSIGGLISAYFSGYLLQKYGSSFVFWLTSIIPLIMTASAALIDEKKIDIIENQHSISKLFTYQTQKTFHILSQKSILFPLLFLVIWNATPSTGSAFFYFQTNVLGFQPEFFGRLGLISSLSSLLGIVLYNQKFKQVPLRTIFKWSCILGTILGTTPLLLVTHTNRMLGIPDTWFVILDDIVLSIFGQITFMPIMILAAKMCPPGTEAMLYAAIMSANNLSGSFGKILGGFLMKFMQITDNDFTNLPLLMIITNLSGLTPLLFLNYVPKDNEDHISEVDLSENDKKE